MNYFPQKLTIAWIKNNYREGTLTPRELLEEIIRRAKGEEGYHIFITPPSMEWIESYLEKLKGMDKNLPLWGIPFAVKDNIDVAGLQTTAACPAYGYTPKENAFVVEKLIEAGAIPVGKTNLDQFATGLVGTRSPYGEVHNALDETLISGGSSSGSAVAVARGMAAFSLGTDTAGSGRVPAALNNLVGYKPSVGAWSSKGVVPACASLDCVTVFANNLEDAELVNQYARGFDSSCCWSKEYPEPTKKLPKKICIPKNGIRFYGPFADTYEQKWNGAVSRIAKLGIAIEYIDYDMFEKAASILYDGPWVAERWKEIGGFVEANPGKIFPVTETILRSGAKDSHTATSLFEAMHTLQEYRRKTKELLKDAVMILPTVGGTFTREEVRENPIETNSLMGLYTNHCNLLDLCAIAVPENEADTMLPFGLTIFALADSESLLLGMAEKFLQTESIPLAVCGLHKKGCALENELTQLGAVYMERTQTAKEYKLYRLPTTPAKPGLMKVTEGGESIEVDVYQLPLTSFGAFMKKVAPPLVIGNVTLESGRIVKGFLCEEYIAKDSQDITDKKTFLE